MNKIGNIIYEDDLVNHEKVDYINYMNAGVDTSFTIHDAPTLRVGWKRVKERDEVLDGILPPQNASILNKEIIPNENYWEFSFSENKSEHVLGVNMFVKNVPHYYFNSKYTYKNINPIFSNIYTNEDLLKYIPTKIDYYYQYKDEMLYLLSNEKIFGVDLDMFRFFDIEIDEFLKNVGLENNQGVIDQGAETYQSYYKSFPDFEYLKRYLVVLLSNA